jgi:N4-gp56 family major capsid protein
LLLDDNRVPKNESFIKGARLVDTLIDKGRRVAYVPTALRPLLVSLRTIHNEKAMTPVEQYSGHNATLNGEIGTIDDFRIVEVPQMIFEEGGGAAPSNPNNTAISAGCCNVYPIITVGQNAFAHIGLESRQGANQFTVLRHMPGKSIDREDIFGKEGRISISWWQGVLVSRPDYISVFWTAAA